MFPSLIIFDLDGTLYESSKVDEANYLAAITAISQWKSISLDESKTVLEAKRTELGSGQAQYSISGSMKELGVPEHIIREKQLEVIHPENLLNPDQELNELIKLLSRKTKLALLTNTPSFIVTKILNALGVDADLFDLILSGDELVNPKPSKEDISRIMDSLSVSSSDSVFVGDRYHVDIAPAKELGMEGRLIKGRDDLISYLRCSIR